MAKRQAAGAQTRERILAAAHELLAAEDFTELTMDAVARKADVSRLTVYYQFDSKAGLLEALYNYIAKRGQMERLAEIFRQSNDPLRTLHDFILTFARFWASDRNVIRRLHALGGVDPEVAPGLLARNQRRRHGLEVILERYCRVYPPLSPIQEPVALDTLHMLTSFETFDALAGEGRSVEEVGKIVCKQADHAIGFTPRRV
ncbi:MAG TPA: TetR/AcrR family transcriptional regulator [Candidatus Sulfotelmatobacter sp.]